MNSDYWVLGGSYVYYVDEPEIAINGKREYLKKDLIVKASEKILDGRKWVTIFSEQPPVPVGEFQPLMQRVDMRMEFLLADPFEAEIGEYVFINPRMLPNGDGEYLWLVNPDVRLHQVPNRLSVWVRNA